MERPHVDSRELFEKMEERLGIAKEESDVWSTSLGAHPSRSFYSAKEPKINLERMRSKFNKASQRY